MKVSDTQFEQLSALVDGEASDEDRCSVLAELLDSPSAREELRQLLDLRTATDHWRNTRQTIRRGNLPLARVHSVPTPSRRTTSPAGRSSATGILLATIVGGLLVCSGLVLGRFAFHDAQPGPENIPAGRSPHSGSQPLIVEPQQRRQAAEVFAFHESVTGPLSWFVSDENEVRLGNPLVASDARQPVAVQLRILEGSSGEEAGRWLVICRDRTRAVVDLPMHERQRRPVRLSLLVNVQDQRISADYSLLFETEGGGDSGAQLAGRRELGTAQSSVGQVFLDDHLLTINAAAWTLTDGEQSL